MTVEIISWSISTKVWDRAGIELATPGSAVRHASVARHVTDCATRPGCRVQRLNEISPIASLHMILSKTWMTKALMRLCGSTGWSASVLFANLRRQVFLHPGPYNYLASLLGMLIHSLSLSLEYFDISSQKVTSFHTGLSWHSTNKKTSISILESFLRIIGSYDVCKSNSAKYKRFYPLLI